MWTMCIWKRRVKQGLKRTIQWSDSDVWSEVFKFGCCCENLEPIANIIAWAEPLPQRAFSGCQILSGLCAEGARVLSFLLHLGEVNVYSKTQVTSSILSIVFFTKQYFLLTLAWFVRIFAKDYTVVWALHAALGEESTLSDHLPHLWTSWAHLCPTGQDLLMKGEKASQASHERTTIFRVTIFPIQGRDFSYCVGLCTTSLAHFN